MSANKIVELFPSYSKNKLTIHPDCENEIRKIVKEGSYELRFGKDYDARMRILLSNWDKANQHCPQWFEHLKYYDSALYSMHLANIGNLRILYTLGQHIIFLCAFKEKEGHGKRRQSYVQYVPIAQKRLEQYKEEE